MYALKPTDNIIVLLFILDFATNIDAVMIRLLTVLCKLKNKLHTSFFRVNFRTNFLRAVLGMKIEIIFLVNHDVVIID